MGSRNNSSTTSNNSTSNSNASANLSFAQALTDARALIVQQSNRIKADAERVRQQSAEIAQLREEIARLRPQAERVPELEHETAELGRARDAAQAEAHRLRQRVENLETATEDLQAVIRQHEEKNTELTREIEALRQRLPSEADASALAAMAALLQAARKNVRPGDEASQPENQAPAVRQAA